MNRPAVKPASWRWWGRVFAALGLVFFYWLLIEFVLFCDLLWRFRPRPRPIADPGPVNDTRVTFIVPTYNQRALMDFCLPALLREAGPGDEIIVVDDAGTDDTADYLRRTYPSVRVIRLETNQGFAGAVRAGIAGQHHTALRPRSTTTPKFGPASPPLSRADFADANVFAVCSRIELPEGSQVETGRGGGRLLRASRSPITFPRARSPPPSSTPAAPPPSSTAPATTPSAASARSTIPSTGKTSNSATAPGGSAGARSSSPRASVLHQRRATIGPRFGEEYADQTFLKNALLFVLEERSGSSRSCLSISATWPCASCSNGPPART